MRRCARTAGIVAVLVWIPLALLLGLASGRSFRIGAAGQSSVGPLVEGVIQAAAITFVPALFAALSAFVLCAWRQEREEREERPRR